MSPPPPPEYLEAPEHVPLPPPEAGPGTAHAEGCPDAAGAAGPQSSHGWGPVMHPSLNKRHQVDKDQAHVSGCKGRGWEAGGGGLATQGQEGTFWSFGPILCPRGASAKSQSYLPKG